MNRILIALIFLIFTSKLSSQITIGNIEKKEEEKTVSKPEPYDSLLNFKNQENLISYKKYIGLQFFLPPFANPKLGTYTDSKTCNVLFATHPSKIKAENVMVKNWDSPPTLFKPSYDSIITFIYAPLHYYSGPDGAGGNKASVTSDSSKISNTYFTVLDVYFETRKNDLITAIYKKNSILSTKEGNYKNDAVYIENIGREIRCNSDYPAIYYLMRNEKTGDSLYCSRISRFILVPYFVKQKALFENKNLISYTDAYQKKDIITNANITVEKNGKWLCKEVTLLNKNQLDSTSANKYSIFYVLKNEKGETIALENLQVDPNSIVRQKENFVLERDFIKMEEEKKLKGEELLAKQKQEEIKKQANEKALEEKRKVLHAKYKAECVAKFGQNNGELIADGKVRIGMSVEMCKASWGHLFGRIKQLMNMVSMKITIMVLPVAYIL